MAKVGKGAGQGAGKNVGGAVAGSVVNSLQQGTKRVRSATGSGANKRAKPNQNLSDKESLYKQMRRDARAKQKRIKAAAKQNGTVGTKASGFRMSNPRDPSKKPEEKRLESTPEAERPATVNIARENTELREFQPEHAKYEPWLTPAQQKEADKKAADLAAQGKGPLGSKSNPIKAPFHYDEHGELQRTPVGYRLSRDNTPIPTHVHPKADQQRTYWHARWTPVSDTPEGLGGGRMSPHLSDQIRVVAFRRSEDVNYPRQHFKDAHRAHAFNKGIADQGGGGPNYIDHHGNVIKPGSTFDMGHPPGHEHFINVHHAVYGRDLPTRQEVENGTARPVGPDLTHPDDFKSHYLDANNYVPEDPSANRSHRGEGSNPFTFEDT